MGIFSFLRRRGADGWPELDAALWDEAADGRRALASLGPADSSGLRRLASWFLSTKRFVPLGGAAPTEADRASIALLACLPILRLGPRWYRGWSTILLEPEGFVHAMTSVDSAGVVTEYDDELSGRVTDMGPVILSLRDVRDSGRGDGYNVVVHEMAHKLDELDGEPDGCPPLPRGIDRDDWRESFSAAFDDFRYKAASAQRRRRRLGSSRLALDEYAAESPEEFFAVACEHFFDTPERLEAAYPEVARLLSAFFAG